MRTIEILTVGAAGLALLWRLYRGWSTPVHLGEVFVASGIVGALGGFAQHGAMAAVGYAFVVAAPITLLYWGFFPTGRPSIRARPEPPRRVSGRTRTLGHVLALASLVTAPLAAISITLLSGWARIAVLAVGIACVASSFAVTTFLIRRR